MKKGIILLDSGMPYEYIAQIEGVDIGTGIYDDCGHGTKSLMILLRYICGDEKLKSIKVLGADNRCSLDVLIRALQQCLEMRENIVCLPLSIEGFYETKDFKDIIEKLKAKGKIIISALNNKMSLSLPAAYSGVIGVDSTDEFNEKEAFYNMSNAIQCVIPMRPIILKCGKEYSSFGGNSLATALCTAHIYCEEKIISYKDIEKILSIQKNADLVYWDAYRNSIFMDKRVRICLADIQQDILRVCEKNYIETSNKYLYEGITSQHLLSKFVSELCSYGYCINNKSFLTKEVLESIEKLSLYLLKNTF